MTPGDILDVTREDICTPGYTKRIRNVPASVKRAAYAEYNREHTPEICCEVDHLIPLELGGSNRLTNLWPQMYTGEWNAKVKDHLENRLHRMVCDGQIDLKEAQRAIASNWVAAYKRYVNKAVTVD